MKILFLGLIALISSARGFDLRQFGTEDGDLSEDGGLEDDIIVPFTPPISPRRGIDEEVQPVDMLHAFEPGHWIQEDDDCLIMEASTARNEATSAIEENRNFPCGVSPNNRIVGGKVSKRNKYPWIVALKYKDQQICAATLINERYALTAAHCIAWGSGALNLTLHFGEHDLETDSESPTEVRKISRLKMHAKYSSFTTNNDIALIEMDEPIRFKSHIRPICLPDKEADYVGKSVSVIGWGHRMMGGQASSVLREVEVDVMTRKKCEKSYGKRKITTAMICAGKEQGGKDACQGDSGGPLLYNRGSRWTQCGIVSWGRGCALARFPGVYTNVPYFESWIERHSR